MIKNKYARFILQAFFIVILFFVFIFVTWAGIFYIEIPWNNFNMWRMDRALTHSIAHPESTIIKRHRFLGTRYINSSECTYVVGEFRSTPLSSDEVLEIYKGSYVDIFGFTSFLPVGVEIMKSDTSLPIDNSISVWADDFIKNVDVSSSSRTYYLVYLYEAGRPWVGDDRCFEGNNNGGIPP